MDRVFQNYKFAGFPDLQEKFAQHDNNKDELRFMNTLLDLLNSD